MTPRYRDRMHDPYDLDIVSLLDGCFATNEWRPEYLINFVIVVDEFFIHRIFFVVCIIILKLILIDLSSLTLS